MAVGQISSLAPDIAKGKQASGWVFGILDRVPAIPIENMEGLCAKIVSFASMETKLEPFFLICYLSRLWQKVATRRRTENPRKVKDRSVACSVNL